MSTSAVQVWNRFLRSQNKVFMSLMLVMTAQKGLESKSRANWKALSFYLYWYVVDDLSSGILLRKNSAYCQINTSGLFFHTPLMQVPVCRVTRDHSLGPGQHSPASLLSPNSFDSLKPVPKAKDFLVTLEKPTILYLSVSARIRVMDPLAKRNKNIIGCWTMQTLPIAISFFHLRASHDAQYLKVNCYN